MHSLEFNVAAPPGPRGYHNIGIVNRVLSHKIGLVNDLVNLVVGFSKSGFRAVLIMKGPFWRVSRSIILLRTLFSKCDSQPSTWLPGPGFPDLLLSLCPACPAASAFPSPDSRSVWQYRLVEVAVHGDIVMRLATGCVEFY